MKLLTSEPLVITKENLPIVLKMAESLPGGFFIYHAHGDQQLICCNRQLLSLFGCSSEEEFEALTGNTFRGLVHPDDYERIERDIRAQVGISNTRVDHVRYRFIRKDGTVRMMDDYGHLEHTEDFGDIFYVFVQDITEQNSLENYNAVLSALSEDYDLLCHIDYDSGKFDVYRTQNFFAGKNIAAFLKKPYAERINHFAEQYIFEEDRQLFTDTLQERQIREVSEGGRSITLRFRMETGHGSEWFELKAAHNVEHRDERCVLIGIKNVNTETIRRIEAVAKQEQQEQQRNAEILQILASEYSSVYYADLNTGEMQITKMSEHTAAIVGQSFYDGILFSDALKLWLTSQVRNRDIEELQKFASASYIRSVLKAHNPYSRIYREGTETDFRYSEMKIVKVNSADGTDAIVVGIADCDERVRAEQHREIEKRRNTEIIEILASEYSSVYYIDLTTDELNPYTMNAETESEFGQIFNSGITYSEAFRLYVDRLIYPEDKEMMLKAGSVENIRQELRNKKTFLTTYRDSDNKYSEMKFVKVGGDNDEPAAVALGFAEKDSQIRQGQLAQQERQMNFDIIEILASEYSSVYYIDLKTDGLTPYTMNEETETTFGSVFRSGITYSEAYKLYVDRLIYPEDKKMMLKAGSVENIRQELQNKKTFLTTYRSSDNKYSEMKFVKVGGDNDEPAAVALGFAEKDDQIRRKLQSEQERQMNFDIIEILASEYSSVYYIDLTTDGLNPYTMNEETETTFGSVFRSGITYSEAFRLYVDKLVFPADKAMMLKAGSIGNIMSELSTQKTFLTTYRNAEGHYSEMKFVKVGNVQGLPTAVALGFADKDAELRAKQEEERVLQRNIDIIEILASEYSSVYYIDMMTDELDTYTMNEQTESQFGRIFRSGIKYSEAFKLYVNTLVYQEDKSTMLKAGSIYNILKELRTKKTFLTTYRDVDGKYCEMKFVKVGESGNPEAVALGFANKDEEIRAKLEREAVTARDAAVISGLSDDFGCVIYADFETGKEVLYRFDPFFENSVPGWSGIFDFRERLNTLIGSVVHPDDRNMFREATEMEVIRTALHANSVYFVNFRTLVNNEITYYQAKFVRDEHSNDYFIAGFHNVDTETRREMDALDRAETASRAKTAFLFNMSHDIRTPMNAIIGYTDLAIRHINDEEKVRDSLSKIKTSGGHLLKLINDILEMSRIEANRMELTSEPVDILKAIYGVEQMSQALAISQSIEFHVEIGEIRNRYIYADELHFNEALMNVISNAIKYTPAGGRVVYRISQLNDGRSCNATYRFEISDNGIGMSEEFQKHIFEAFSREKSSTVSKMEGAGLGLSIVKKIVDLSGGTIDVTSKQGEGSVFVIEMTFRVMEEAAIAEFESENVPADYASANEILQGKRVLLAEDNVLNREIAEAMLTDAGLSVDTVEDGLFAVEAVKRQGVDYYDFILMDIQMPAMDGYEATKAIRALPGADSLPIIALSANAFAEDRAASLEAGMNDHVAKPVDVDLLIDTVSKYL